MKSYADIEAKVLKWGADRGIVQHGVPLTQALKTLEEVQELLVAINAKHEHEAADAIGDIWVTLVLCAATMDMKFLDCCYQAYDEIKDRKGYLRADGIFVKEVTHANQT